ncbi:MFS transporter [Opitutia bacterium ISCC 51]|nr:MFS transporter [Opitutae bacterium ISCC 51]QXD29234.1 MFS transporter [Opitutae bacterium ISCC 52]
MSRAFYIILISAVSVGVGMGARQSLGLFLQPISESLSTGRGTFSLAIAVQNILFGLPFAGMLADKIGPRWVVVGGAVLYAAGFAILSAASSVFTLYFGMGVLVGLALSGTSYVVVLGAVARVVPAERRSTAFGIVTAAGSFGTFAVVPGMQWLINAVGWESTLWYAAVLVGIIGLFALGYPSGSTLSNTDPSNTEPLGKSLRNACTHSGYLLLNIGFFVCGFHVAFIATHLPAYLADHGLPKMIAATALSLIGLFNMGGSYLFGRLGDRYRKKYLLSILYGIRALIICCFLIVPVTNATALIFACFIGFVWLATVPLTSGTVAQIFGSRHLSSLYGIVFFSHQLGSFLGVWLGGRIYDASGSYNLVWIGAIILGFAAAIIHLPIKDAKFQSAEKHRAG